MKNIGKINYSMEAEGAELGDVRLQGSYSIAMTGLTMPLKTDIVLAKAGANVVVGLGGITTVKFLYIKAVFPTTYTETDATIELLINDGGGEITMTGTQFMLVDTDITSIKLTNNSHDTTGADATVFIDLGGV